VLERWKKLMRIEVLAISLMRVGEADNEIHLEKDFERIL
jgi:hypothetical protein